MGKLNDIVLQNHKPQDRPCKVFDGQGLYIEMPYAGAKVWRYKCMIKRECCSVAIGHYPMISIEEAGKLHQDALRNLQNGIDPVDRKNALETGLPSTLKPNFVPDSTGDPFDSLPAEKTLQELLTVTKSTRNILKIPDEVGQCG
ncbi:MAG: Arm DNA-binding domain-containing protein [Deltaproteobacteria bacterium]|jgi:hypothetical protein|nr:Arm DNA-binding domain-containing protein [Deltaproteobacteria bacterium]